MRTFLTATFVLLIFSVSSFAAASATDIPLGQSAAADDLFETQRGYFHPSLSLSEVYTDNLFNQPSSNAQEEFITVVTPGLWLAFPGQLKPAAPLNTDTTSAGGLTMSRFGEDDDRPFQAFLNYEAAIKSNKNFSSEDITTHMLHGLLRGTLTSGLSLELADVFNKNHDAYATGSSVGQNEFTSNLIGLKADIPIGERFKLRLAYSNFLVDYDTIANNFRDRSDNSVTGYLYYALSQKTKLFTQYSFLDVGYDNNVTSDNTQQHVYMGIDYSISEKVQAMVKLGYGSQDRDGALDGREDFIYEVQADYQFTQKNNLNIAVLRKLKESDAVGTNGILGSSFYATFSQMLGQRLVASAVAGWSRDEYDGLTTVGIKTAEREDDYLTLSLSLGYAMQKWFEISGGYNYVQRDSNFNNFDYDSNGLFINLTGKL